MLDNFSSTTKSSCADLSDVTPAKTTWLPGLIHPLLLGSRWWHCLQALTKESGKA